VARSALVVLNRSAGTGHAAIDAERLAAAISEGGSTAVTTSVVDDHPQARKVTSSFVVDAPRPALVVAAGGGGTLRAVVEGVMDSFPDAMPGPDVVSLGAMRMGSGNVIARRLGVPLDPIEAATQIGRGWVEGATRRVAVLRCRHASAGGGTASRHAVTMAGFGAWGSVPGDIERWRASHAGARRRAASWVGLERVNTMEYVAFGSMRMLAGTVRASRCELVEMDHARPFRLLAAVALTLPLPPLPDPHVELGDEAAGIVVVPRLGRPFRRLIEPGRGVRITLVDRESAEFFLDEDPEFAHAWIELEVPGCLAFVPAGSG
jgi:hypothetical protein